MSIQQIKAYFKHAKEVLGPGNYIAVRQPSPYPDRYDVFLEPKGPMRRKLLQDAGWFLFEIGCGAALVVLFSIRYNTIN